MKLPLMLGPVVLLALAAIFAADTFSQQDEKGKAKAKGQDEAELTRKWAAFMTPGPEHAFLDRFVGEWETESRHWVKGPAAPPSLAKGKASVRWILGGLYIQEDYQSEVMNLPFRGLGITGFDKFRKKYQCFWIDSMGSAMWIGSGTLESNGTVLNIYGTMDEPLQGAIGNMYRFTHTMTSDDEHLVAMFDLAAGHDFKVMEIVYKRAKAKEE